VPPILELTIKKPDHSHEKVRGVITDLFAKDHVDHFRLGDGREFFLAQIVGVKELNPEIK
jgi:hypothetical protein